ncbi:unnamed protein product [Urochloa humidicola]
MERVTTVEELVGNLLVTTVRIKDSARRVIACHSDGSFELEMVTGLQQCLRHIETKDDDYMKLAALGTGMVNHYYIPG